jgi:hypothetical protein
MKKSLLTLALVALSAAATYAQGTIQFLNTALQKIKYEPTQGAALIDAPTGTKIGVFWGTDAGGGTAITGSGRGTLVTPTGAIGGTPGVYNVSTVYAIPGTDAQQRVWLKIAGWDANVGDNYGASGHYGESIAVSVALGPTSGPGTVVFQSNAGTDTTRAKPFNIMVVPEPSVIALGALGLGALLLRRRKA